MNEEEYIRPEDVCKYLKITTRTLYNWDKSGKLNSIRTQGGHRRYKRSSIEQAKPSNKQNICYCRVSTYSQKEDLERQVEFFRLKYPTYTIIKDIGSGINFNRKGFNSILDSAIKGDIGEVVVTTKDRLCRFGFDLISRIIKEYSKGSIVVLNQQEISKNEELINDLISIITVFSSRLYGLRSNKIKKEIKKIKDTQNTYLSDGEREREITVDDEAISMVL